MKPNPENLRATDDPAAVDTARVVDEVQAIAREWQADPGHGKQRVDDLLDEAAGLPR
jgi:hypothetical protein